MRILFSEILYLLLLIYLILQALAVQVMQICNLVKLILPALAVLGMNKSAVRSDEEPSKVPYVLEAVLHFLREPCVPQGQMSAGQQ